MSVWAPAKQPNKENKNDFYFIWFGGFGLAKPERNENLWFEWSRKRGAARSPNWKNIITLLELGQPPFTNHKSNKFNGVELNLNWFVGVVHFIIITGNNLWISLSWIERNWRVDCVVACLPCAEHWAGPAPLTHTRENNQSTPINERELRLHCRSINNKFHLSFHLLVDCRLPFREKKVK